MVFNRLKARHIRPSDTQLDGFKLDMIGSFCNIFCNKLMFHPKKMKPLNRGDGDETWYRRMRHYWV